jgi:N-hydroxyarylamine O-acetyltransferase
MLDVDAYLRRIHYHGNVTPSKETLRGLHRAHMLTVPFENLYIHARRPLTLDEMGLFHKIVGRRRGGFCYELNGLFAILLRALGFKVTLLGAQVVLGEDLATLAVGSGPFTDHLTLLVELEEHWLADVGFGNSFVEPLKLDAGRDQVQGSTAYRLRPHAGGWLLLRCEGDDAWQPQYFFTTEPRTLADFAADCQAKQQSPFWNERPRCSLATPDGRVTVTADRLIVTAGGERHEQEIHDHAAYVATLLRHCGVDLAPEV